MSAGLEIGVLPAEDGTHYYQEAQPLVVGPAASWSYWVAGTTTRVVVYYPVCSKKRPGLRPSRPSSSIKHQLQGAVEGIHPARGVSFVYSGIKVSGD
jgi:hypothetical protein